MSIKQKRRRSPVIREHAQNYLLISLVAFSITVILIRAFLHFTGYPQISTETLHIAHALWGGLILFAAVLLPLTLNNSWAIKASALLSGIGVGLFIDEVGKFITQTNDYFFPPALSLIYGFFLLNVLVYLYFCRPRNEDPRRAMYRALQGLQEVIDGDLDTEEDSRIEAYLDVAKQSDVDEIVSLATCIRDYLNKEKQQVVAAKPGLWKRIGSLVDTFGRRFGRNKHRIMISALFILWVIFSFGYIVMMVNIKANVDIQILQWRTMLIVIQSIIGGLMTIATVYWFIGYEERGLRYGTWGVLLSLVGLQLLYFYLYQIFAIIITLLQFILLQILLSYRRWYLR